MPTNRDARADKAGRLGASRSPLGSYSPHRRTAVVLCGTGAHGAYHAGVLRALHEAGVKIDVLAGHGVGAGAAALAAIDGAARLWEHDGVWPRAAARGFYPWKPLIVATGWIAAALVCVLLAPVWLLAAALVTALVGFLLQLLGMAAGAALVAWTTATVQTAFSGDHLPTSIPRLAMLVLALLVAAAFAGVGISQWRAPVRRRSLGGWWWQLAGAPLDPTSARRAFESAIWQLIRGAASPEPPAADAIGRRYAEVLTESLGQPGFRELIVVATDLDTRADVVASFLREPYRHDALAARAEDGRADVLDLSGTGRMHALEIVGAALTPPLVCDPALLTFAADSHWRGETHRLCDRPGISNRLLEEVAAAGVSQVIVVSAVAETTSAHALRAPALDLRHRLGDFVAAAECASLRDGLAMARLRFDAVHLVAPAHNPIGPFDFLGTYDQASDRRYTLRELTDRGAEDAYRQFIEPVVGASGEQLVAPPAPAVARATAPRTDLLFDDLEA